MSVTNVARPERWTERRRAALEAIPPLERSVEKGVLRVTHGFRGLSIDQAVEYLEQLGGERLGDAVVAGDGWEARMESRTVPVGPSYRLREVAVTWTGDTAVVDPLVLHFRLKAFRAPG